MKNKRILKLALIPLIFSHSSVSFGSALVIKDDQRQLITVQSEINFFGPMASEEVARAAATEIQTYWNGGTNKEPACQYFPTVIHGKTYQVVFEITYQLTTAMEVSALMHSNPGPEKNFIKILQGNAAAGDRSYMTGLGSNSGVWYLSDSLGKSTTTAHEYGHGLGLDHPDDSDWRGRGQPSLMCPRGTFVDAIYQYNPAANPDLGEPGSTINPYIRRAIQWDINNLQFSRLDFDIYGRAALDHPVPFSLKHHGPVY